MSAVAAESCSISPAHFKGDYSFAGGAQLASNLIRLSLLLRLWSRLAGLGVELVDFAS